MECYFGEGILLPEVSSVDSRFAHVPGSTGVCWSCAFAVFPSSFLISYKVNSFQLMEQYTTQALPVQPGAENLIFMIEVCV